MLGAPVHREAASVHVEAVDAQPTRGGNGHLGGRATRNSTRFAQCGKWTIDAHVFEIGRDSGLPIAAWTASGSGLDRDRAADGGAEGKAESFSSPVIELSLQLKPRRCRRRQR